MPDERNDDKRADYLKPNDDVFSFDPFSMASLGGFRDHPGVTQKVILGLKLGEALVGFGKRRTVIRLAFGFIDGAGI